MPTARSDAFARKNYSENLVATTTTYGRDGSVKTSQNFWTQVEHSCVRQFKSTNRRKLISGTSTPWISPSTYERGIMELSNNSGTWIDTKSFVSSKTVSARTIEGPPNTGAGFTMYRIDPIFNGSPYISQDGELARQAQTEALKKLGDNKAQLGAALAEALKTGDMLAEMGKTFFSTLLAAKRGHWSRVFYNLGMKSVRPTRHAAENYLKLKYGLIPLMSDIYGTYTLFQELVKPALLVKAHATVHDRVDLDVNPTSGWARSGSATRTTSCHLFARIDDRFAQTVNRLGLANPALIAWEVVPFSFVFDWGIPVANTLEAMTATQGLKFVGGYTAYRGEGRTTATLKPTGNYVEQSPRSIDVEYFGYIRVRLSGFPRASFYAKNPFSRSHAESAVALARVLYLR